MNDVLAVGRLVPPEPVSVPRAADLDHGGGGLLGAARAALADQHSDREHHPERRDQSDEHERGPVATRARLLGALAGRSVRRLIAAAVLQIVAVVEAGIPAASAALEAVALVGRERRAALGTGFSRALRASALGVSR